MSKLVATGASAGLVPPRRTRPAFAVLALTVLALAAAVLSLGVGSNLIPPGEVGRVQGHTRNPLAGPGLLGVLVPAAALGRRGPGPPRRRGRTAARP